MARRQEREHEHLTCPVCFELPPGHVVQCLRGHAFCAECLQQNTRCPQCRTNLPDPPIRNLVAEAAIAVLPAQCTDCEAHMTKGELRDHTQRCPKRRSECCAMAVGCAWVGTFEESEEHERTCPYAVCVRMLAHQRVPEKLAQLEQENRDLRDRVASLEAERPAPEITEQTSIVLLCRYLVEFRLRSEVVDRCCERLAILVRDSETARQEALDAGAIVGIVHGMKAHVATADVQRHGCLALGVISFGNDAAGHARKRAATDAGALAAIVECMQKHVIVADVQKNGCLALSHICGFSDAASHAHAQAAADAGAIGAVVSGMRAHVAVADVQRYGCGALHNICVGDDAAGRARQQAAADAGGLVAIVGGMQAHANVADVQKHGCLALGDACFGNDANGHARKQAAVDVGALTAIIACMQAHVAVAEVQENGCFALGTICVGDDTSGRARKQSAADLGALAAIVKGMQTHVAVDYVQEIGRYALRSICTSDELRRAALRVGAQFVWLGG